MSAIAFEPLTGASTLAVTFHLAGQRYALPLEAVGQVVRLPDLIQIVGAPPAVCGQLNLRGAFLPVLSGRALVGAPEQCSLESCVLLLIVDGRPALGLLADEVDSVQRFPPDGFAPAGRSAPFVAGLLCDHDVAAILLDPAALVAVARGAAGDAGI